MPDSSAEQQADLAAAKRAARSLLLRGRTSRSADELAEADARILAVLSEFLVTMRPQVVAVYVPFGTEPGAHLSRPLPDHLAASTAPLGVYVPEMLEDHDLDWRDWRHPDERLGVAAVARADVVIVPALAVDAAGVRLGRGGGSYDRALARVRPSVPVVALLHEGELAHTLPALPHDRRVSAVITPTAGMVRLPLGVDEHGGRVRLLALDQ